MGNLRKKFGIAEAVSECDMNQVLSTIDLMNETRHFEFICQAPHNPSLLNKDISMDGCDEQAAFEFFLLPVAICRLQSKL